MILARGSNIKPVFEKVDFQNEDGSLKEKELVLTRTRVTGFLRDGQQREGDQEGIR